MGGGGSKSSGSSSASIAPELKPLFKQTGTTISNLQPDAASGFSQFFQPNVQQIPGFTPGQEAISQFQGQRAFGSPLNFLDAASLAQLNELTGGPLGQSPATIAAMQAVREPVLNDLALAGLGNSSAVGSDLGSAFAPILAQEQALRFQSVPLLQNLSNTAENRQSQFLSEFGATEEARRGIEEARGQAALSDFLRRQGLGSEFTTGILGNFPSITGGTTSTKTSGGGLFK